MTEARKAAVLKARRTTIENTQKPLWDQDLEMELDRTLESLNDETENEKLDTVKESQKVRELLWIRDQALEEDAKKKQEAEDTAMKNLMMKLENEFKKKHAASTEEVGTKTMPGEAEEKKENEHQAFTKLLVEQFTNIGKILMANENPGAEQAAEVKKQGLKSLQAYSSQDAASTFSGQLKSEVGDMTTDRLKMEIAKQMVMFDDRPKRRMYKVRKPNFGTNTSLKLNESLIAKHLKGGMYYHDKKDNTMSILKVIQLHSYLVEEMGMAENNWVGIMERFYRKDNSRLAILLMTAEKAQVPLMEFYERILGEFDGDYDEVALRDQLQELLDHPHKKPLEQVFHDIDAVVSTIYMDKPAEEYEGYRTSGVYNAIYTYLTKYFPVDMVSEFHARFSEFRLHTNLEVNTEPYILAYQKQAIKKFKNIVAGERKPKPAYLHHTAKLELGNEMEIADASTPPKREPPKYERNYAENARQPRNGNGHQGARAYPQQMNHVSDIHQDWDEGERQLQEIKSSPDCRQVCAQIGMTHQTQREPVCALHGNFPGKRDQHEPAPQRQPWQPIAPPGNGAYANQGPANQGPGYNPQRGGKPDNGGNNKVWERPTLEEVLKNNCWKCGMNGHIRDSCDIIPDRKHFIRPNPCLDCNAFHDVIEEDNGKCVVLKRLRERGYTITPYERT